MIPPPTKLNKHEGPREFPLDRLYPQELKVKSNREKSAESRKGEDDVIMSRIKTNSVEIPWNFTPKV